jgi:hypothetical protein
MVNHSDIISFDKCSHFGKGIIESFKDSFKDSKEIESSVTIFECLLSKNKLTIIDLTMLASILFENKKFSVIDNLDLFKLVLSDSNLSNFKLPITVIKDRPDQLSIDHETLYLSFPQFLMKHEVPFNYVIEAVHSCGLESLIFKKTSSSNEYRKHSEFKETFKNQYELYEPYLELAKIFNHFKNQEQVKNQEGAPEDQLFAKYPTQVSEFLEYQAECLIKDCDIYAQMKQQHEDKNKHEDENKDAIEEFKPKDFMDRFNFIKISYKVLKGAINGKRLSRRNHDIDKEIKELRGKIATHLNALLDMLNKGTLNTVIESSDQEEMTNFIKTLHLKNIEVYPYPDLSKQTMWRPTSQYEDKQGNNSEEGSVTRQPH